MGMDEDNDDGLGGRSRDRRELTAQNRWGRPLCALSALALAAAPLPDAIRAEVALGRTLKEGSKSAYRARDRQYQRIDKLVRSLDDDAIAAIDAFLEAPDATDTWIDDLLDGGDEALQAWLDAHPGSDRNHLRALIRAARRDPSRREALAQVLAASAG